ncbi:MAG: hypothetical protein ABMB14_35025, partial [Myxococcota bacterium]
LTGCGRTDPELDPRARALAAWEAGRAALDAGDFATARTRFHDARALHPVPLLGAWEARAAAAAGDNEGAVALLDAVLDRAPTFAEARYNRAAYLVRLGRIEHAAADLRQALDDGPLRSMMVLEDPDFASVLDHPAFAFLPQDALTVVVTPPPPTAFWGAEVPLHVKLLGIVSPPLSVTADRATGPLELLTVTEDTFATSLGTTGVDLGWTWRVAGAGPVELGPLSFRAGRYTATADVVRVDAQAPPGKTATTTALTLDLPSEWIARVPARTAVRLDGQLVAHALPSDRVTTEPELAPPARYELREAGTPTDVVLRWSIAGPATVRIRDAAGAEVYAGP